VPFATLLVSWASVCFASMSDTDNQVSDAWAGLDITGDTSEDDVSSATKLALLVAGCLLIFAGAFMIVNIAAYTTALRILSVVNVDRLRAADREILPSNEYKGNVKGSDLVLLVWAAVTGFISIFLDGTFAIFNDLVDNSDEWFLGFWIWLGKSDSRYLHSDSGLVAVSGVAALVGGPLCLALVIAILNHHSSKYGLAITVALLQCYSVMMYWGTEIHVEFRHVDTGRPGFWIVIFFGDVFRLALAFLVLHHSFLNLQRHSKRTVKLREQLEELRALLPSEDDHRRHMAQMRGKIDDIGPLVVHEAGPATPTRVPLADSLHGADEEMGFLDGYRSPDPMARPESVHIGLGLAAANTSVDSALSAFADDEEYKEVEMTSGYAYESLRRPGAELCSTPMRRSPQRDAAANADAEVGLSTFDLPGMQDRRGHVPRSAAEDTDDGEYWWWS